MFQINSQLKELVKTGHLLDARQMFDKMPHRDEITWTTLISGYVGAMESSEALFLFTEVWVEPELQMDPFIISLALKASGHNYNATFGELLHGYSEKTGFVKSVFVGSALLDMYMKVGKVREGCQVFEEMPLRNVVSWTALITGLVHANYNDKGLVYFSEMCRAKVRCDSYTFAIALKACANSSSLNKGREIHAQTMKKGLDVISFVSNTLATMYNKCGKLGYGWKLFESIKTKDVVSWTAVITTYVQTGQEEKAIKAFVRMRQSNVSPNEYTYAAVLSGCAGLVKIEWGEQLHAHVLCLGLMGSLSVSNSITAMYSKCGDFASASMIFNGMIGKDIVSWSTMIGAYSQGGYDKEAFELLSMMRREGPKPTEFAFASVLSACGITAILDQGRQLHAYVLSIGLDHTSMVQSALINMYSKCGSIKDALQIFYAARVDDIVSWTAMINGYAEHGCSQEAIDLFERILEVGLRPDAVTYIGVLTACSHAGLVDLGFHYLDSMGKDHNISPSKEHYGCMVDLFCRAGRLRDAEDMIKSMPFKQDDVVWSTLLRACRLHGDVECGRRAAEKILRMNPNCVGTHITLANLYAAKGKWREVADMRRVLKEKGVIKEPGWSWIKVKEEVSTFAAGDGLHPMCEEIYKVVELLTVRTELTVQDIRILISES